jgi:hypothetical protein
MSCPRIRFFCSPPKQETGTQTSICLPTTPSKIPLMERLQTSALEGLLSREVPSLTPLTHLIVDSYNTRLSLYVTMIHDPRFDILTPPVDLFAREQPGVIFEFYDQVFTAVYPEGAQICQVYTPHFFPVIECLETGVITRDCAVLLKETINCHFVNGCVLCKCVDHRFHPAREITTKLEIGADVLPYFYEKSKKEETLKEEMRLLALRRPIVCTDPSPDVARVQSVLDFRKKMWITRKERTKMEDVVRKPIPEKGKGKCQGMNIQTTKGSLKVTDAILKLGGNRSG